MQQQSRAIGENRARSARIRREVARIETVLTERRPRRRPPQDSSITHERNELETPSHGTPPAATAARDLRKTRVGQVVSNKMAKTAVVETVTRVPHAKFGKIVKQVKKFYAHDEEGKAQVGDTVRITETRPLSKLKRWRLVEIVKH